MFWYYDPTYWMVLIGALIALYAQFRVSAAYSKWSRVPSSTHMTGAQIARQILDGNGCQNVRIEAINGKLTDHYDPENGVLRLSSEVYGSTSIAALGVAAHEAGHAIQDAQNYAPLRIRSGDKANLEAEFGDLFFALAVLFYVVTLPVEFNASGRAVAVLSESYLPEEEVRGVKAVLSAAALTYVAAALQALLQLLRLILLSSNNRRRD